MKYIKTKQEDKVYVDDCDYEVLKGYNILTRYQKRRNKGVRTFLKTDPNDTDGVYHYSYPGVYLPNGEGIGKGIRVTLYRFIWEHIMGREVPKGHKVWCYDGNPFNCARNNIVCTNNSIRTMATMNRVQEDIGIKPPQSGHGNRWHGNIRQGDLSVHVCSTTTKEECIQKRREVLARIIKGEITLADVERLNTNEHIGITWSNTFDCWVFNFYAPDVFMYCGRDKDKKRLIDLRERVLEAFEKGIDEVHRVLVIDPNYDGRIRIPLDTNPVTGKKAPAGCFYFRAARYNFGLADNRDKELILKYSWNITSCNKHLTTINPGFTTILPLLLLDLPQFTRVDCKNGDYYDVRRKNLVIYKGACDCAYVTLDDGQRVRRPRKVYEEHFGEIPEGYVIYHKDGDKRNDAPGNLEVLPRGSIPLRNFANS